MNDVPQWIWPLLSVASSAFGSWVAVKITVARLEVKVERAVDDIAGHARKLAVLDEDSLTHDMELEHVLNALKLKRARRQPLRGYDAG